MLLTVPAGFRPIKLCVLLVNNDSSLNNSFNKKFEEATTTSQKLFISTQEAFYKYTSKSTINDSLREQLSEQREIKATLKEQLHAKQRALDKTGIEIQQLRVQDRDQRETITALKSSAAQGRTNPEDTAAFQIRMRDLELANINVSNEKKAAEAKTVEAGQVIKLKDDEVSSLHRNLEEVKDQLAHFEALAEDLRAEHVTLEKKMEAQRATEKEELIQVATRKAERLRQANEREKHQLRILIEDAEKRIQKFSTERNDVSEVTRITTELEDARKSIKTLEKEMEKQVCHPG